MSDQDPAGKPQVYKLRRNWSYCLMERLPIISKNQTNKRPWCKLPKAQREFLASQYRRQENISYSMQTQKLIPRQVELNSRQESEFNPQTGSREIGVEDRCSWANSETRKRPTQPENYRPISLLSTLSKLTENFILDKLNEHLAENKILCPEQFGFRKSLTTTHQLLRVVEYITSGFEKGECTGAVFLDVQKAFDRVWIQGLIHKLIRYKTPPHLLQLLKSYLEERKFAVKIGNSISEAKIMRAGIPQGGKISPVLYSLYVNDIPKTHKTLLGMYADDTAILAKNKNHKYTAAALNQHLAKLDDWFLKWKIALNVNKTEAVYFAKGRRKYKPVVKINPLSVSHVFLR
ncbi:RNA-directed DNA polymerase from mobile element jockey [Araneus ventricosus]|uniref:RNA-directed DNA polymerase from mobile element jockey n=1 Tax=Araneus ventricosus TaxID=182803 RepID=A0A4Y2VIL3_ARAVE|nr:RNA-directed DNA polymerase from mobile element jockey [Araneus ventricosus]